MASTPQVSDELNHPLDNGVTAAAPVPATTDGQAPPVEAGPRLRRLGIHGPRQSGKTCYLTVLHRFRKSGDAAVVLKDDATIGYLQGLWDRYLVQGKHTPRTAGLPAEIRFDVQAGGRTWEVQTRDYPGERVQRPVDAETLAWLEACDAVLVFVDATSPPDLLAERLNEVDLLLSALRQLSHDGNTIARPLGLVLTKWDTQGPIAAAAPDGEEQRAHAWLSERPEFRQFFHALQHAGHPDRVKVFPVSAFGENRGGTDPPEGGPRVPLNLHAPLVWAMRLGDERLLETARRRASERLNRWWPNYRGALAEYDEVVAKGINKGPLFDEEIEPERRRLRQRLTRRRLKSAAIVVPLLLALAGLVLALLDEPGYERALAALDDHEMRPAEVTEICRTYLDGGNPAGRLLGRKKEIEERLKSSLHRREEQEFEALRKFRDEHRSDDQARQREEQARTFRERWPGSAQHALVRTWEDNDRAVARAQERRDEQRGDYEVLRELVKTLTADEGYDQIIGKYDLFLKKWPAGEQARIVRDQKDAVMVARHNKEWAEVVRYEQRIPRQHESVIGKAKPFLVSSVAAIRDQAQKMVARHEAEWDREDYDLVRRACNEAREPSAVARARRKALDHVRTEYPPRQRKASVQKWLDWFEGLQKPRDYYITVREVDIPPGSGLRDLYGKEEVRVHIRIGATVHITRWNKGKGSIDIGEKIGPFRAEWGKEETIEVRAEEYDTISANDWSMGRKTDPTFVMFWADGPFSTRCAKNKDVKVYLECSQVVAPKLPAYEGK